MPVLRLAIVTLFACATAAMPAFSQTPTMPSAQAAAATPVYDVVSIKPHKPGDNNVNVNSSPGRYAATNISLKDIIAGTYNVKTWLVLGLPPWAESSKWDITGKISEPDLPALRALTRDQRRDMVKVLLRDSFKLQMHPESKVVPVFEMTVLPEGPKFKPSAAPPPNSDGTVNKDPGSSMSVNGGHLIGKRLRMESLAENLSYRVERVIVDRTGLTSDSGYDVELIWTSEDRANAGADNGAEAPPEIFTALKEQLGLKLNPAKAPVPTLMVDHVEKPEEN